MNWSEKILLVVLIFYGVAHLILSFPQASSDSPVKNPYTISYEKKIPGIGTIRIVPFGASSVRNAVGK